MSTYNTVVFVTTKSIADTLDLPMLATADRTSSNLAQTEWTWDWVESNKIQPLLIWMYNSDALEEHFMFLRTGESDEDVEVIGTYACGYRIGIIAPESESDDSLKLGVYSEELEALIACVKYVYKNEYTHFQESDEEEREFHIYEKACIAYNYLRDH